MAPSHTNLKERWSTIKKLETENGSSLSLKIRDIKWIFRFGLFFFLFSLYWWPRKISSPPPSKSIFLQSTWHHLGSISSKYVRDFFALLFCKYLSDYYCQTLSLAKFDAFCGEWHLANGAQIWRISTYIIGINIARN